MDGAVPPHVFTSEKRLSNFNGAGRRQRGGGAASIVIAEGRATRVEPTSGWITNVEVANEETAHHPGLLATALPQHEDVGGVPARYLQVGSAS